MTDDNKIYVIGVSDDGADGLTAAAQSIIERAQLLIGGTETLAAIPGSDAERFVVGLDLEEVVTQIAAADGKRIVLLAAGDPLFYGTARFLCERLGKERFEVIPHVSSMQLAFARVKESWDEAYLTNLATQSLERLTERVRSAEKVGIFTTSQSPPSAVARFLLDRRIDYFRAYICENLGSPDERVTQGELDDVAEQQFSPLNVMILVRKPNVPDRARPLEGQRLFGNPDEMFLQSKPKRGLLTSAEVRTIALSEMALSATDTVWDVGAGSGSVAIEAAQIANAGSVFAIEMDLADHDLIVDNAKRFGVGNLHAVLGQAPDAWHDLPSPDAVFVGGTGRQVRRIVELGFERLNTGGRIVVNVASPGNLSEVQEALRTLAQDNTNTIMINLAHGTYQLETVRFEATNPTFLLVATKS